MNFKRKTTPPFSAHITIGLQEGYTELLISKDQVIKCIQEYQDILIDTREFYLSASVSETTIVLSGQVEPHLKLSFINYPKFSSGTLKLKQGIESMAKHLMENFNQNRLVIEYNDETVMLEVSEHIDNRIRTRPLTKNPFLLTAIENLVTSIEIIDDESKFPECLQEHLINTQKIIINPSGKNFTINHSRNHDYWYMGVNEEGEITSKGAFDRNKASGSCASIKNDEYLIIFEDEVCFRQTEYTYRNSFHETDIKLGVEGHRWFQL